ncbi:MAG: hypothetical protein A3H35_19185 [Betaproteobacteria bacterium RIFCSPLOWO2_02_FULL_62_17]|nr:MAG: hypothetical protein A3H35_19185 [Betaproteobacteria bacterium RIFCSPLOWO2_02_FULL_62_17]
MNLPASSYNFTRVNTMTAVTAKRKLPEGAAFKTSFGEEASKLRLVGCISGPPDLATNRKKYLKALLRGKHQRPR